MIKLGYAVDLGTTTIDSCIIDCDTGDKLSCCSRKNRQSLYGSDVINRILNATRSGDNYDKLRSLVLEDLVSMLEEMLSSKEVKSFLGRNNTTVSEDILEGISISGNTTMISILLGYDVASLGSAPFQPVLKGNVKLSSRELFGACIKYDCAVVLTGCVGAFLGGDILAGIVGIDESFDNPFCSDKNVLLIDLGTNGEIVLNAGGKLYGTSTACGPAFEGCTRRQGVYGATTVDSIVLALKTGKLTREGILADDFFSDGITINGVRLDMDIIRNILMAKAAVYSGIVCLCEKAGVSLDNISEIYLAGGFGFYLNLDNAYEIGLLPSEFRGKVKVCGNSSLTGAALMLRSKACEAKIDELSKDRVTLVQLADEDSYKKKLIENMTF